MALLYLAGSLVAIKMWRHEVGRRRREAPSPPVRTKRVTFEDEVGPPGRPLGGDTATEGGERPGVFTMLQPPRARAAAVRCPGLRGKVPGDPQRAAAGGVPGCVLRPARRVPGAAGRGAGGTEEAGGAGGRRAPRAQQDGGQRGGSCLARGPEEEEELLGGGPGYLESHRQDSAFLEKQRRCRYLQEKLRHIKRQIQDYDRGGTVYF
nr:occludin/ELL domain-containing protein 1 isoform X2 [Anas platyrhynchos]